MKNLLIELENEDQKQAVSDILQSCGFIMPEKNIDFPCLFLIDLRQGPSLHPWTNQHPFMDSDRYSFNAGERHIKERLFYVWFNRLPKAEQDKFIEHIKNRSKR
jgi:hypothetical protein